MSVSIDDQVKCIQRELSMRKACYPRWVESRKMKQETADREIASMEAVLVTLAKVVAGQ